MSRIPAVIIGAGQAGLAMSHCLARHSIAHVVLERKRIAERWRSERWDSLRLLSPNWMSRLPGWSFQGNDPDGFMTAHDFADHLVAYARHANAPIQADTAVRSVRPSPHGYVVKSNNGSWEAASVIIATGHCAVPAVPPIAQRLPNGIRQITPSSYRNPDGLPDGGVLVVGASATGIQIADEICRIGDRPVTLAVGSHTRAPRMYRGRDIWCWLDAIGTLDDRWNEVADIGRVRNQASFQLVGRPDSQTLNLATLHDAGVSIAGRLSSVNGRALRFNDDLTATLDEAQTALERMLARIETQADQPRGPADITAATPIRLPAAPTAIDLVAEDIRTVVWATGYQRDYRWLHVPVLDANREIIHDGGVTPAPGLYVLGLRFMRRRRSNFIDGVGCDAEELSDHLVSYLASGLRQAA